MSFIKVLRNYNPAPDPESLVQVLPPGNYIPRMTLQGPLFENVDPFIEQGKMYGDLEEKAARIFYTFQQRPLTTGVILAGQKGAGKTQIARLVSRIGYQHGVPTLLIQQEINGVGLDMFLNLVPQPKIVLIDEYEKLYDRDAQETLLSLFDGLATSKTLFILTTNNLDGINRHMINRPGRLFYMLKFSGVGQDVLEGYARDNLNNLDHLDGLLRICQLLGNMNFDMLKALIEEMNRYEEPASEAIKLLNISAEPAGYDEQYEYQLFNPAGQPCKDYYPKEDQNNFLVRTGYVAARDFDSSTKDEYGDTEEDSVIEVVFKPEHITNFDIANNVISLAHPTGYKMTITKTKKTIWNSMALANAF